MSLREALVALKRYFEKPKGVPVFSQTATITFDATSVTISITYQSSRLGSPECIALTRLPVDKTNIAEIALAVTEGFSSVEDWWRPTDEPTAEREKVVILGGGERQRVLAFVLREMNLDVE